jgi:hypothetical protein
MPIKRRRHTDPHKVTITVQPASPSRHAINITVHQEQDPAGNWLLPTITISQAIPQTSEDVVFMQSLSDALRIACLEFIDMMDYIT